SHAACHRPGLDRSRAGVGTTAPTPPRDHRRGAGDRRPPHGPGAAAADGRQDRGAPPHAGGPGAGASAAPGAEGRLMGPAPAPAAPTAAATRTVAVTVPDWPLLAALDRHQRRTEDAPALDPAAAPVILLDQHRVTHAGAAAREAGVLPGMKRRAARAVCPEALVLEADGEHESALFELVAAAVDTVAAGVDVLRPGVLLMSARGPARHQGGEEALAERILDAVAELTGWDCAVGIADGPFAALLASPPGRIVREGRSAEYLAPHPIQALRSAPVGPGWGHRGQPSATCPERRLDLAETVDLLQRLGIMTLG